MASVEGSPQMFDWSSSPDICVAPDQGPCLFILGPVVALIESDQDQSVRMQVTVFWRNVEETIGKDFGAREYGNHPASLYCLEVRFPSEHNASEWLPEFYKTPGQEEMTS